MASDPIEVGRQYFCREQTGGEPPSGMFQIGSDEISATFYSFDKSTNLKTDDPLILRLEDNRVASLHRNTSHGDSTSYTRGLGVSHSHRVTSNVVVIGDDAWVAADPVRRVQFTIGHAEPLMHHDQKFDAVADAELGRTAENTVFDLAMAGIGVKVWYTASGRWPHRRATTIGVRYSVEFDEPADLNSYLTAVGCIVGFTSAAMGFSFVPSEIQVSRLSHADFLKSVEDGSHVGDHEVRYIWHGEAPAHRLRVANSFVHARDDKELAALVKALSAWIKRDTEWRNATDLMMGAFGLEGTMSGERLLMACKWLEAIPGASSAVAASRADIDRIASVAGTEAERLGYKNYKNRIVGVVRSQLKTESHAVRFERLRGAVCARFGDNALPADALPSLMRAMEFRGKVAHGAFEPIDDREFPAFAKSVYAMEALCYLLTIKDLPMTEDGATRALGIEIVANCRRFSKAPVMEND